MPSIEKSALIEAPVEYVYDFVANDVTRLPEFVEFVLEVFDVTEGPVRVGTSFKERVKLGPFPQISNWTVAELDPSHRVVWVGHQSDMEMTLTKFTRSAGSGTLYSQVFDYRMLPKARPIGRLLEKLVVHRRIDAALEKVVARIKEIVEAEYGAEATVDARRGGRHAG